MKSLFLFLLTLSMQVFGASNSDVFTEIYKKNIWGYGSGEGSKLENNLDYIQFLNAFMKNNNIRSVVDLGCGDWQFSYKVDWGDISYLGLDCVAHLIERNQRIFGSNNIQFKLVDCVNEPLPEADLLISKDCLQHLDNISIKKIITHFNKYKFCLITNDVHCIKNTNKNIKIGDYRCLDLTKSPFFLKGKKVFEWRCEDHGVTKATFLFVNNKS
jgi:SAM-dependent methyltransferase